MTTPSGSISFSTTVRATAPGVVRVLHMCLAILTLGQVGTAVSPTYVPEWGLTFNYYQTLLNGCWALDPLLEDIGQLSDVIGRSFNAQSDISRDVLHDFDRLSE